MSFDPYIDHAGLLVNILTENGDGSNSAQMMGMYRFGRYLQFKKAKNKVALDKEGYRFTQELDTLTYVELISNKGYDHKLYPYPGIYVRHPSPSNPLSAHDPNTFGRDQQRSLIMAMGALKQKKQLKQILWQFIKRSGLYQDGKGMSPNDIGEYVRAAFLSGIWSSIILWPLLLVTDLFSLFSFLINFFFTWNIDDNDIMSCILAKHSLPTPISFLVRKLYKRFGYVDVFASTYRTEPGYPPLYDLYKDELKNL
jgi:hypothetical protein